MDNYDPYDPKDPRKVAPHFQEVYITKDEVVNREENEGRKFVIDIGNQCDEKDGGACYDFITTSDMDWINPDQRFKIILCEDTVRHLIDVLQQGLRLIKEEA